MMNFIIDPNFNDVLFGRDGDKREFNGTKQFHLLCQMHRAEYYSSSKKRNKTIVANKVINAVQNLNPPGRFLRAITREDARRRGFDVEKHPGGTIWQEVDEKTVLEKTKQYIRDSPPPLQNQQQVTLPVTMPTGLANSTVLPSGSALMNQQVKQPIMPFPLLNMNLPQIDWLMAGNRVGLAQNSQSFQHPPVGLAHGRGYPGPGHTLAPIMVAHNNVGSQHAQNVREDEMNQVKKRRIPHQEQVCSRRDLIPPSLTRAADSNDDPEYDAPLEDSLAHTEDEQMVAKQLLSMLTLDELPKFLEEDERKERLQMTEEEHAAAVQEVFGWPTTPAEFESNSYTKRPGETKRAVVPLLTEMKRAIKRIPAEEKEALLEAQINADAWEFSDERLEVFLRREEMDPNNAAERFVAYWRERRNVFGPEKYCSRITLDKALSSNDYAAIRAGVYDLLSHKDLSGRCIVFRDTTNDSREGYTRENAIRVFWYVLEVISQSQNAEYVYLSYGGKSATLFNYDHELLERVYELERNILPARMAAQHVLSPTMLALALRPIAYFIMDKRIRARTHFHDLSQCPGILVSYGILKHMLPTALGGHVEVDRSKWMEERKVAESAGNEELHGE